MAAILWTAWSVLIVTLLSLGAGSDPFAPRSGHLTRTGLLLCWVPAALLAVLRLWLRREALVVWLWQSSQVWTRADLRSRVLITLTALSVFFTGLVALLAAPNNWDSMFYHLPRVATWLQLGGVRHFATTIEPQLYHPPGAELLIAQLQALAGGDQLAALVQWGGFVGCITAASLAAQRLGAGRFSQLVAAFVVASTPMVLMQASSTQNDLLLSFWLITAATFAIGPLEGRRGPVCLLAAALALGFALLTKGTAFVLGLPVGLLLAGRWLHARRDRASLAIALLGLVLIVLPNISHWQQNRATFGSAVSAGSEGAIYRNAPVGPSATLSNLVRSSSLHLSTPSDAANRRLESFARGLLEGLGIDPDDPGTTFPGETYRISSFGPHEDHAGNPLLLLLAVLAGVATLTVRSFRTPRRLLWLGVIVAQLLLLSALLRWQPWSLRFDLPVFVLSAPLVAAFLISSRKQRFWPTLAIVLMALPLPVYWTYNYTRPLVGERSVLTTPRADQYFTPRPNIAADYRAAIDAVNAGGSRQVGLVVAPLEWTYPFQALRADRRTVVAELMSVGPPARYNTTALPETVVCINCSPIRLQTLREQLGYREVPLRPGPVRHDANLEEVPAELHVFRRDGGVQRSSASESESP